MESFGGYAHEGPPDTVISDLYIICVFGVVRPFGSRFLRPLPRTSAGERHMVANGDLDFA